MKLSQTQRDALLGLAEQADRANESWWTVKDSDQECLERVCEFRTPPRCLTGTLRRPKPVLRTGDDPNRRRSYPRETGLALVRLGLVEMAAGCAGTMDPEGPAFQAKGFRLTAAGWRVVSRIRAEEDWEPHRRSRDWFLMREALRGLFG